MTALIMERMRAFERWTFRRFPVAFGTAKIWKHALIGIDLSTGKVEPAHAESDLFIIGVAAETVDASALAVDTTINVNLCVEIEVEWWASAGGISAANVGSIAYCADDQTVTLAANGCVAGRIWAFATADGVAVQKLPIGGGGAGGGGGGALPIVTPPAFTAGDMVIADSPAPGSAIAVPATAIASTVTLPAVASEGTWLIFTANGVANGHTVQYRDATGPAVLTTALTALKRHCVIAAYVGGKWHANAYVSP
jgi:hypothetical protein